MSERILRATIAAVALAVIAACMALAFVRAAGVT